MPYLASLQESAQSISIGALFPLPSQIQWPSEPEKVSTIVTNWPAFTVALLEPLEEMQIWQDTGASIVRVPQAAIQLLERLYTFRQRAEVLWFLERYPFLAPLLLEAYEEIGYYFPCTQVFLEVVADPEAADDYQLVISIATNLAPDKAVNRLERFDEDWWLDTLDWARGKLCINVEFR